MAEQIRPWNEVRSRIWDRQIFRFLGYFYLKLIVQTSSDQVGLVQTSHRPSLDEKGLVWTSSGLEPNKTESLRPLHMI